MHAKIVHAIVTAYCSCVVCTGHTPESKLYGLTRLGTIATEGVTVACAPSYLGRTVLIFGLGYRVCEDTGSKVKANHIDVYFDSHEDAEKFAVKRMEAWIFGGK